MPFDVLPNRLGSIPPIYQYQNLPAIQPAPIAQYLAAIAGPATQAIGNAIERNSPEEKQKRALAQAQLQFQQQKLAYINLHPEAQAAIFGGDSYIPELQKQEIQSRINANNALTGQRNRSGTGSDSGIDLNSYFDQSGVPELPTYNGLPVDIPNEGAAPSVPAIQQPDAAPVLPEPSVGAIPNINVPDSAKLVDLNAPSPGVYSTDTLASPDSGTTTDAVDFGGGIQLTDIKHYQPPPPGKRTGVDDQGRITYDNGVVADPKTRSIEWTDGHGNTFRYAGGQGVEIIKNKSGTPKIYHNPADGKTYDLSDPQKPQEIKFPGDASIPEGAAGDAALEGLSEDDKAKVRGLSQYKFPISSYAIARSPAWSRLIPRVLAYNPQWSVVEYDNRKKLSGDYYSTRVGTAGGNIIAVNTAIAHLNELDKASAALDNSKLRGYNTIANYLSKEAGSPEVKRFNAALTPVKSEVARAFTGSAPTVYDKQEWEAALNAADSPEQLRAVIRQQLPALLKGRIDELGDFWKDRIPDREPPKIVSQHATEVLKGFGFDLDGSQNQDAAASPSSTPSTPMKDKATGKYFIKLPSGRYQEVDINGKPI